MKTILVLNCGSSSVKYALYSGKKEVVRGLIERVGQQGNTHKKVIQEVLSMLVSDKYIASLGTIDAVGHRVVHGGSITKSVRITTAIMKKIKDAAKLAPLHNPHNIAGIKAIQKVLPNIPQAAVFDTTFHSGILAVGHYALPQRYAKTYKRYGFHGISYQYVCQELKKKLKSFPKKLIVCHLGNGSSIAAIKNGKCIDTSMGFTPVEGLVMGTRTGDIDAGIVLALCREKGANATELLLNTQSGLFGLCMSSDMRIIRKKIQNGDRKAKLALDMYCYRLQKYVGSYAAALGGVDALVFTAGIGENGWWIRKQVCDSLKHLGIVLDTTKNRHNKEKISKGKVTVYVLPTNEEKMIALEVNKLLSY
jgi:acetate kinase